MSDVTFEQVLEMAEQLTPEEQARLVEQLQETLLDYGVTREQLWAELKALRAAGAFDNVESLYSKFANPAADVSEEELSSYLHKIGTEWEEEMDELADDRFRSGRGCVVKEVTEKGSHRPAPHNAHYPA